MKKTLAGGLLLLIFLLSLPGYLDELNRIGKGTMLSEKEAIEVARKSLTDASATWSASLEGNPSMLTIRPKHPIYIVEALLPTGGTKIYRIDAVSGEIRDEPRQ